MHWIIPFASCDGEYSASPLESTRTVPTPSTLAVITVSPPVLAAAVAVVESPLDPQAESASAAIRRETTDSAAVRR